MSQGKTIESITLEALFSSSDDGFIPVLIDIQHDAIYWGDVVMEDGEVGDGIQVNGHMRLINSKTAVKYSGHKYLPCNFNFSKPSEDGQKISNTSITISAIDQRIIEVIRKLRSAPIAIIEAYYTKMNDVEFAFRRLNSYTFQMSTVSWDNKTAKWTLVYDPVSQTNVPRAKGTKTRCPSIAEQE